MTCKSVKSSGPKENLRDSRRQKLMIKLTAISARLDSSSVVLKLCFLFLTFYKVRSFIARVQDVSKVFVFFNIQTGFIYLVKYIIHFMVFLCLQFRYIFFFFSINRVQDVLEFLLFKRCFKLAIIIRSFNVLKILCLN